MVIVPHLVPKGVKLALINSLSVDTELQNNWMILEKRRVLLHAQIGAL